MNLSIIIVSYNTKELLKKCLESVVGCLAVDDSEKEGTEIIVVDNGSSDGSVEAIKKLTDSKINGLTVRLIENNENLGFSKAVNQALRLAQGEAILLLNSDTRIKKNTLDELLKFKKKVGPAIIGARMLNSDGSVQGSVFNLPTIKRAIEEFWLGKNDSFSKYAPQTEKAVKVEAVSGGAMLISGEVIEKIGLFDERYFMYFEDLDYCRKAGKAGFKVWYLPTAEIIHEHGASGQKLVPSETQWKRLVPSSKIYHGSIKYYLINFIIRTGQRWQKVFGKN